MLNNIITAEFYETFKWLDFIAEEIRNTFRVVLVKKMFASVWNGLKTWDLKCKHIITLSLKEVLLLNW